VRNGIPACARARTYWRKREHGLEVLAFRLRHAEMRTACDVLARSLRRRSSHHPSSRRWSKTALSEDRSDSDVVGEPHRERGAHQRAGCARAEGREGAYGG
jgi:hypothetical protein